MPKVTPFIQSVVERAFERYETDVEASELKPASKLMRINQAEYFVRWLKDDYEPGESLRRSERRAVCLEDKCCPSQSPRSSS